MASQDAPPLDHGGPVERHFDVFPAAALAAPLHYRFAAMAARHPDRVAVADAARRLTYAQLGRLAGRIAGALAAARLPMGQPVGILLAHEARFPAAMLAASQAGHPFVPLDATHPAARLAAIAADAGLAAVVSAGDLLARAASLVPPGMPVIDLAGAAQDVPPPAATDPAAVAMVLYTSGSTGAPKGVFQDHRGLLHDVLQYANAIHLAPDDRLTSLYSPATAGAVRDIWAALLTGAALHIHPPQRGAVALAAFLHAAAPSVFHAVPVVLRHLAATGQVFASLRLGYIAGDRLDAGDVADFFRLAPNALLLTGLGTTEASTIYVQRFIPREPLPTGRIPVGHAMPDRLALLLDAHGTPTPPGELGEIHACSPYIARGYWRDPALTAARFSDDPDRPGWRRFRTGDLGRWRPDGLLEHLGRADQMVKIGGQRVELAAVEAALKALPGIAEAAALLRPPAGAGQPRLVAHVVPDTAGPPGTVGGWLAALRRNLPAAMVPVALVVRDRLALLPNFKVDRAALARDDAALRRVPAADDAVPAEAAAVARLAGDVLALPAPPAADADILALGADSIALVGLAVALEDHFARPVPLEALFAARTARRLGAWIAASAPGATGAHALLATFRAGPAAAPPLVWPHDIGGGWHGVGALLPLMPADRAWIGLRDPAGADATRPADSVEAHAMLLVAALRAAGLAQDRGAIPIGWSYGGRLAWEIAAQMAQAGWRLPRVVLIDAPPGPVGAGLEPGDPDAPWRQAAERRYRMASQYHAAAAPLDLVLLRSTGGGAHLADLPDDLGWSGLARSVTIRLIPGDHLTLWTQGLPDLARALAETLAGV
ncbi:MAG: AMP-binding protein [Acetobacteraceae bacterium]|nr:AMP-binding protein [Acetobacteraceae bacterium]